jgi:hypothetical protein
VLRRDFCPTIDRSIEKKNLSSSFLESLMSCNKLITRHTRYGSITRPQGTRSTDRSIQLAVSFLPSRSLSVEKSLTLRHRATHRVQCHQYPVPVGWSVSPIRSSRRHRSATSTCMLRSRPPDQCASSTSSVGLSFFTRSRFRSSG